MPHTRDETATGTHDDRLPRDVPTVSPLPLMQLSIGFWSFKALAAAYELDVFAHLSGTVGRTTDELAAVLGVDQRPAELLVTACASLGLLERRDGRWGNSALADEFLVPGGAYHFGGWVQMLDRRLYPAWSRLTEAVRTNRPTSWNPDEQAHLFDSEDPQLLALFWEAMHSLSTLTARELGSHVDLSTATALLDVGGGSGGLRHRAVPALPAAAGDGVRPAAGLRDRLREGRRRRLRGSHRGLPRRLPRRSRASRGP
jgi:hypothetical protein